MNRFKKILLATLGGIDAVAYIMTPILLVFLWVLAFGFGGFGQYLIYGVGLISSIFRGIKIGWFKK